MSTTSPTDVTQTPSAPCRMPFGRSGGRCQDTEMVAADRAMGLAAIAALRGLVEVLEESQVDNALVVADIVPCSG
jgi:hypothetical protein